MDAKHTVLRDAEVLIHNGRIAAIGKSLTALPRTRILDCTGCLLLPGLVQGHVHLGQTFFRGLAERRPLLSWLRERIWPLEAAHDDESAYWCTLLGAAECLLSGTTTVQDIGIGPGARGLLLALADSRLRAVAGKCLMDEGDGLPSGAARAGRPAAGRSRDPGRRVRRRRAAGCATRSIPASSCPARTPCGRASASSPSRHSWPIHTHGLEQLPETEFVRSLKGGRDEIEYFDDCGILDRDLRLAHGVWLGERHFPRVRERQLLGGPLPRLEPQARLGHRRRGRACAAQASRSASAATAPPAATGSTPSPRCGWPPPCRQVKHGPAAFSGRDALALATREGARALGLENEVGIDRGGQAGRPGDPRHPASRALSPRRWSIPTTWSATAPTAPGCATSSSKASSWWRTAGWSTSTSIPCAPRPSAAAPPCSSAAVSSCL